MKFKFTTMTAEIEQLLANVKFGDLMKAPLTPAEQVNVRNLIFKLRPARLKQVLTIIQRVEPDHVHISQAGINIDIKKLSLFTQRYLQKFLVNAANNECPSRKAPEEPADEKESDAPQQEFKGVKMATGIKDNNADVGLVGADKEKEKKPKPKSPYGLEIDEYVNAIRKELSDASANYWKGLTEDLKVGKMGRVFALLGEVVVRTKKLVPEKDHKRIDDQIDVTLIQKAAENGALDGAMFMGMFDSIHATLRSLHPPALDVMWDAWRESIVEQIQTGTTWHDLLPAMINQFLLKLDKLEEMIAHLRRQAGLSAKPTNSVNDTR